MTTIDLIIKEIERQETPSFLKAVQALKDKGIINSKKEGTPMEKK